MDSVDSLLKQGKELYEAKRSDDELLDFLASGAAVDVHLADQLVPFLALPSSPSSFTCPALSPGLRTVAWTVQQFLPVRIEFGEGRPRRSRSRPDRAELHPDLIDHGGLREHTQAHRTRQCAIGT